MTNLEKIRNAMKNLNRKYIVPNQLFAHQDYYGEPYLCISARSDEEKRDVEQYMNRYYPSVRFAFADEGIIK